MAKETMLMDDSHAFLDRTGRYPLDAAIRKLGYSIYERKKGQEPQWCKRSHLALTAAQLTGEYVKAKDAFVYFSQSAIVRKHGREIDKILDEV